jgi:hypothetical protein
VNLIDFPPIVVNRVFSRARALKIKGISGDFYEKKRGKRGIFLWFFLLRKGEKGC